MWDGKVTSCQDGWGARKELSLSDWSAHCIALHASLFCQLLVIIRFRAEKDLSDHLDRCFSLVIKSALTVYKLLIETVGGLGENPVNIYLPHQALCSTQMCDSSWWIAADTIHFSDTDIFILFFAKYQLSIKHLLLRSSVVGGTKASEAWNLPSETL